MLSAARRTTLLARMTILSGDAGWSAPAQPTAAPGKLQQAIARLADQSTEGRSIAGTAGRWFERKAVVNLICADGETDRHVPRSLAAKKIGISSAARFRWTAVGLTTDRSASHAARSLRVGRSGPRQFLGSRRSRARPVVQQRKGLKRSERTHAWSRIVQLRSYGVRLLRSPAPVQDSPDTAKGIVPSPDRQHDWILREVDGFDDALRLCRHGNGPSRSILCVDD